VTPGRHERTTGGSLLDPAFDAGLLARAVRQAIVREVLDASLSHLVRARWEARIASALGHGSTHSLTALA
jgi:hypothetical protein